MTALHTRSSGIAAIIIASLLWGTTGTAASYAPNISALAIGAFAMGVGGILLVLSAYKSLYRDRHKLAIFHRYMLLGGVFIAVYPLAFYSSMRMAGVAVGTVVSIASAPFFAAMLERLFSQKLVAPKWWVSFAFGAAGIALLALGKMPNDAEIAAVDTKSLGVILGLVAGLTYAGYSWTAKQLIDRNISSKSSMASMFGCAALLLLPSLWLTGDNLFASVTNTTVVLYMALVPMFIGYVLFGFGLKSIEASDATLITLIEPIAATLLAILILDETFSSLGWVGMGLVGLCLVIQSMPQKRLGR